MSFSIDLLPDSLTCPCCGQSIVRNMGIAERFEMFSALALRATIMGRDCEGYDLCDSSVFPGLTFQVKHAFPYRDPHESTILHRGSAKAIVHGRQWTFKSQSSLNADWYLFFGVLDTEVYPFAIPLSYWEEKVGGYGRTKLFRIPIDFRIKNTWKYEVKVWPDDLYYQLETRQLDLFLE